MQHAGDTVESFRFGLAAMQCRPPRSGNDGEQARIDVARVGRDAYKAMLALQGYVNASGLEKPLLELVKSGASQINARAFCVHMHTRDARKAGELRKRLDLLAGAKRHSSPNASAPPWHGPRLRRASPIRTCRMTSTRQPGPHSLRRQSPRQ